MVNEAYNDIEYTFQLPERKDLGNALQSVREYSADIEIGTLSFPPLSANLMKLIYPDTHPKKLYN